MKQLNCLSLMVVLTVYVGIVNTHQHVFRHNRVLVEPDIYVFNWNYTDKVITGELKVKTNGWILFGLTENDDMNGADVIVAWINDDDGQIHFSDRHIIKTDVLIDTEQNWFLISGEKKDGYTSIVFTREIETCDPNEEDIDIEGRLQKAVFAWGTDIPLDGNTDISLDDESNKGILMIPFISELNEDLSYSENEDIIIHDLNLNVSLYNFFVS